MWRTSMISQQQQQKTPLPWKTTIPVCRHLKFLHTQPTPWSAWRESLTCLLYPTPTPSHRGNQSHICVHWHEKGLAPTSQGQECAPVGALCTVHHTPTHHIPLLNMTRALGTLNHTTAGFRSSDWLTLTSVSENQRILILFTSTLVNNWLAITI